MTHEEIVASAPWGQSGVIAVRTGGYTAVVMLLHKNQSILNGYRSEFRGFSNWHDACEEACRRLARARPAEGQAQGQPQGEIMGQNIVATAQASARPPEPVHSLVREFGTGKKLLVGHRPPASVAKGRGAERIAERAMARLRRRERAMELTRHLRGRRAGSASLER